MSLTLVFNHHALPYPDANTAEQAIDQFIGLIGRCKARYGLSLILLDASVDESWFGIEVAQGYFWRDWFHAAKQRQEMRDQVRILRSLQTRKPMLLPEDLEQVEFLIEVTLADGDENYTALQAAYWYETWLLSFPSGVPWIQANIAVKVSEPDEEQQDFIEKTCELGNLCDERSLEIHLSAIQQRVEERLQAGKEIWEQREQYFPKLVLLDAMGMQLKRWSHRKDILHNARDVMLIMNDFAQQWQAGTYAEYQHAHLADFGLSSEVSGESISVRNDSRKRREREFWLPRGEKVFCENHIKFGDGYRMHFYPDSEEKCIYVAYLGNHLKI